MSTIILVDRKIVMFTEVVIMPSQALEFAKVYVYTFIKIQLLNKSTVSGPFCPHNNNNKFFTSPVCHQTVDNECCFSDTR